MLVNGVSAYFDRYSQIRNSQYSVDRHEKQIVKLINPARFAHFYFSVNKSLQISIELYSLSKRNLPPSLDLVLAVVQLRPATPRSANKKIFYFLHSLFRTIILTCDLASLFFVDLNTFLNNVPFFFVANCSSSFCNQNVTHKN